MAKAAGEQQGNRNQNNNNSDLKKEIKEKTESPVISEEKTTDIRKFGTDQDCIVVELVGTFRNMWNYLNKKTHIQRMKEGSKEFEIIPIEFTLEESKDFEFLSAQTVKLIIEGVEVDKSKENFLKFANKKGEDFSEAMTVLVAENLTQMGKLKAKTVLLHTLGPL